MYTAARDRVNRNHRALPASSRFIHLNAMFPLLLSQAIEFYSRNGGSNQHGTRTPKVLALFVRTIDASGATGNAKQSIVLTQDGGKITGTFKGPRQSGTIDGTVDGNDIKFHVIAGIPFLYTGTVDSDSMPGTMTGRGKTGNWKATRAK
jgi:hypothetical protein